MEYTEITFQDGDKTLRVRVPNTPIQIRGHSIPWYDDTTLVVRSVLAAISPPPAITYQPPPRWTKEDSTT